MNWLQAGIAAAGLGSFAAASVKPTESYQVFISGDTLGYLSPCGCTDPMSGGIRRRIEAVDKNASVLFIDNGALVKEPGRQSEMKAEAMAQALAAGGVDAINLTSYDALLGKGSVLAVSRLSGGKLISTHLEASNPLDLPRWMVDGQFIVGAVTTKPDALKVSLSVPVLTLNDAVREFANQAFSSDKIPVLLLEGSQADARGIASDFPSLRLIVYRTVGDPPAQAEKHGDTLLVTPGDRGRNLLKLVFDGEGFSAYQPIHLGPEHKNDADASRIYAAYLKRVSGSKLLQDVMRFKGEPFAGTQKCISCHAPAGKVWKKSGHAHALATLEKEGHGRDPDCVSCHVVGLQLTTGFKSRQATPSLADVGCESCHGAGGKHARKPSLKMPTVTEKTCVSCHTTENSPRFDFKTYWQKIRH